MLVVLLFLAGVVTDSMAAFTSNDARLRILTYNLARNENTADLKWVGDALMSHRDQVDLILTQEVLFTNRRNPKEGSTASRIADQMGYFSVGSTRASGREGVAIISRHPILYLDVRQLADHGFDFKRVAVLAEVSVPGVGRIRAVSLHLAFLPFERDTRRKQLTEALEWVAKRETEFPAEVTVLGGDLNAPPGSPELRVLFDRNLTRPLCFQDHNGVTPSHRAFGISRRLDYIHVSTSPLWTAVFTGEKLLWPDRLGDLSDHLPVLHEYELTPAGER